MVLAGVQAIEISAFDEAYRTPSPASHLVGLRTQQVIHLETNTTKVIDPLGGSYYMEALTDELERRIWDMVQKIEGQGDPAKLSDDGWFKRNIFDEAMQRYAREIREQKLLKVGVNCFQIPEEEDTLLKEVAETKIEPCFARIAKIREYKRTRDQGRLRDALQALQVQARTEKENLLYPIMEAVKSGATMGEVGGVVRLAYGVPYDPFGMVEPPVRL
jgi:methylmalonyl-CoA mutase, N-terminal domain